MGKAPGANKYLKKAQHLKHAQYFKQAKNLE